MVDKNKNFLATNANAYMCIFVKWLYFGKIQRKQKIFLLEASGGDNQVERKWW